MNTDVLDLFTHHASPFYLLGAALEPGEDNLAPLDTTHRGSRALPRLVPGCHPHRRIGMV